MSTRKYILILLLTAGAGAWLSCTKADDYKKYLVGGVREFVYTGKADSLKIFPGQNRVLLTFILLSDPTITGAKVYWNSRTDSATMPITRSAGADTIHMVVGSLPEGIYNFEVTTFDARGNRSVPADITSNVYGDNYASTLLNIPLYSAHADADNNLAFIVWGAYDPTVGLIGTEVNYTGDDGLIRDSIVVIGHNGQTSQFPNFAAGSPFQYRTLYLPEPTAIDTFASPYTPLNLQ